LVIVVRHFTRKKGAAMYSTMLAVPNDVRFYGPLLKFDRDLAAKVREERCPVCGAAYLRKPRGDLPGWEVDFPRLC
jgi:hypothetical protein